MVAGLAAAVVCALIWGVISYYTGYEIGWIAWGIGAVVGLVVAATGKEGGMPAGLTAAGIALLALVGGKVLAVQWDVGYGATQIDPVFAVMYDRTQKGELQGAPADWILDREAVDVPAAIEAEFAPAYDSAYTAFEQMDPAEVEAMQHAYATYLSDTGSLPDQIIASLSFWDLLWVGLALVTAYQIASKSDEIGAKPDATDSPAAV